jgi:hypothetical protein
MTDVNVDTLVETIKGGIFGGPGPVTAALSDLAARARERDELEWGRNWQYDKAIGWRERALSAEAERLRLARRVAELEAELEAANDNARLAEQRTRERVAELEAEREEWLRVTDIPPLFSQATPHMTDEIRRMRLKVLAGDGGGARATICEECGSGILDGKHIADYPCSRRAGDGGGA